MRLHFARKERIEFGVEFEFGVLFGRNEVACKRSLTEDLISMVFAFLILLV